jgi:hypothetical protein
MRMHRQMLGFTLVVLSTAFCGGIPAAEDMSFRRGDANDDGQADLSDAGSILMFLFLAGDAPPCAKSADCDDNGSINLTDPVSLLRFLYLGGTAPPAPGPDFCGPDPTADALDCLSCSACVFEDKDEDGMDDHWEMFNFKGLGHGGGDGRHGSMRVPGRLTRDSPITRS